MLPGLWLHIMLLVSPNLPLFVELVEALRCAKLAIGTGNLSKVLYYNYQCIGFLFF